MTKLYRERERESPSCKSLAIKANGDATYILWTCLCVEERGWGDIFYFIRLPCNHQIGAKVVDARLRYVSIGETHLVQHIVHPILDATLGFSCAGGGGEQRQ